MQISGKWVIGGIVLLAVSLAGASLWHHQRQMRRSMALWGTDQAVLIARAPEVRALRLDRSEGTTSHEGEELVRFGDAAWLVSESQNISTARGLSNVRLALVQDVTFDWQAETADEGANWRYALVFRSAAPAGDSPADQTATVLFDFVTRSAALAGTDRQARLDPFASDEIKAFIHGQLGKADRLEMMSPR